MQTVFPKLLDFISDRRWRKPLLIALPALLLVLCGVLLWSYQTERTARLRQGSGQSEYQAIENIDQVVEVVDVSQMPPEELPENEPRAEEEAVAEVIVEPAPEEPYGWTTIDGKEYYQNEDGSFAVGLKEIGGKLYYFDIHGVKASSLGVDVSFYNNKIDWNLVKEHGIDFAIIRVGGRGWTGGLLYDDCRTRQYLVEAREAGLKIGVYFYSTAISPEEAVEEASVTLKALDGMPLDFPVFIDMEWSGEYPHGRSDRLSPSERAEIVTAFCETVRNSGYTPGVYGGQNYMKQDIDYYAISRYTVWLASYTRDNKLPFFEKHYDIWQFSDRGRVNGIPGDTDMNVIF